MTHALIAVGIFVLVTGSACVGLYLRSRLPEHHVSTASTDAIKLATGLVATLAALVLGLLVSSAKNTLDTVNGELVRNAAHFMQLDRLLDAYGEPARALRADIVRDYAEVVDLLAANSSGETNQLAAQDRLKRLADYQTRLMALSATDDTQRQMRAQAVQLQGDIVATRWLVLLQREGSVSVPLIIVLVLWLIVIFMAFGLLSPPNGAVICGLFLCALSAAGAIFLILEMDRPLDGLIHISVTPLRDAITHLQR